MFFLCRTLIIPGIMDWIRSKPTTGRRLKCQGPQLMISTHSEISFISYNVRHDIFSIFMYITISLSTALFDRKSCKQVQLIYTMLPWKINLENNQQYTQFSLLNSFNRNVNFSYYVEDMVIRIPKSFIFL